MRSRSAGAWSTAVSSSTSQMTAVWSSPDSTARSAAVSALALQAARSSASR